MTITTTTTLSGENNDNPTITKSDFNLSTSGEQILWEAIHSLNESIVKKRKDEEFLLFCGK
jgi:hypothetical protein